MRKLQNQNGLVIYFRFWKPRGGEEERCSAATLRTTATASRWSLRLRARSLGVGRQKFYRQLNKNKVDIILVAGESESSSVIAEQIYKSGKHTLWFVSPTLASMPPNSSRPCASSPLPPSASSHVEGDEPNDTPGPMDAAYWKRMYQALHQETNTLKASKRKRE
jgi:hypothetical protein